MKLANEAVVKQLYFLMEGSRVERFHTRPLLKPDTNGRHQHGVAMLCWLLWDNGPISTNLLMAALTHDLAEQLTGDTPAPTKWAMGTGPSISQFEIEILATAGYTFTLTKEENAILKLADYFDGMMTCIRERTMGNKLVMKPMLRWTAAISDLSFGGPAVAIYNALTEMWVEAMSPTYHGYNCFELIDGVVKAYEPTTYTKVQEAALEPISE